MSTAEFTSKINGVALNFLYLAIGAGVMGALQQFCWLYTSNRQVRGRGGGRAPPVACAYCMRRPVHAEGPTGWAVRVAA